MKKIILVAITICLFIMLPSWVFGSYAVSSPGNIIVEQGSSKEFYFQIQGYRSDTDLECKVDLPSTEPLVVSFNQESVEVSKGSFSFVYGIVKSPSKADIKDYSYDFCVSCAPKSQNSGATMNLRFCGIPLKISVVEPPKEKMSQSKISVIALFIIAIVVLVVFLTIKFFRKD